MISWLIRAIRVIRTVIRGIIGWFRSDTSSCRPVKVIRVIRATPSGWMRRWDRKVLFGAGTLKGCGRERGDARVLPGAEHGGAHGTIYIYIYMGIIRVIRIIRVIGQTYRQIASYMCILI